MMILIFYDIITIANVIKYCTSLNVTQLSIIQTHAFYFVSALFKNLLTLHYLLRATHNNSLPVLPLSSFGNSKNYAKHVLQLASHLYKHVLVSVNLQVGLIDPSTMHMNLLYTINTNTWQVPFGFYCNVDHIRVCYLDWVSSSIVMTPTHTHPIGAQFLPDCSIRV